MRLGIGVIACAAALHVQGSARAETVMLAPGDDVEGAINAAQPGDELVLAGGTYELTDRFGISVRGTAEAPIVVRAAEGQTPVFSRAGADQNVIDVDDAEHLVLRGLTITGGSHGLRLVSARFVTIEACEIHDTGDVALSANSGGSYEGLSILRNHIHHTNNTGEGMYLGCNDDACRVFNSLIEGNYVHHTNGPTVEQGDGIELKEGSHSNIIRDNVIHDTKYPCILTYGVAGNGAPNVIEANLMWGCGDHGIQSAADAIIRNNIILGASASGIAMQPHQSSAPSNLIVAHNTILHTGGGAVRATDIVGLVVIGNNAIYERDGQAIIATGELGQLVISGNVGMGTVEPNRSDALAPGSLEDDFVSASFTAAPSDVFPKAGSALIASGRPEHSIGNDFNHTSRMGIADVGAYAFAEGGNPGWTLAAGPKGEAAPEPALDAGTAGTGGGTSGDGGPLEGGASGTGSAGSDAGTAADGDGGGCRIARRSSHGADALLLLPALALLARRASSRSRRSRAR